MSPVPARRALTATVIAVGTPDRTRDAVPVLQALAKQTSVRNILISLGTDPAPEIHHDGDVVTVHDLLPRYLNNVVARLRLSSMPSLAWWRGGEQSELAGLAQLVDRISLDSLDPTQDWATVGKIREAAAVTDLRWARLTRWRNLMAQFFDIPETQGGAAALSTLEIRAGDPHAALLFGRWMAARLPAGETLDINVVHIEGGATIEGVTLAGEGARLQLRLLANRTCIESCVERNGEVIASRVGPAGDERLATLLAEELRVRSRDLAFEEALDLERVGHG